MAKIQLFLAKLNIHGVAPIWVKRNLLSKTKHIETQYINRLSRIQDSRIYINNNIIIHYGYNREDAENDYKIISDLMI